MSADGGGVPDQFTRRVMETFGEADSKPEAPRAPNEYRLHGPPGCGKTYALAKTWAPRAAKKFGAGSVVICSLTRTAAREVSSRELPIPSENIGTLHALAYRALGKPRIAETAVADFNDYSPTFVLSGAKPSLDEPDIGGWSEKATRADELAAQAQVLRHNRTPLDLWPEAVAVFHSRWREWMSREGLVDFTGMIEDALDAVPTAPGSPAVFIVDEAQDCSVLELDLVRKWAAQAQYAVLAGDGDQAIYGWRGASARAFLDPDIPPENNYHLTKSHRVPVAVHAVAAKWIEQASYRYAVEYQPRDFGGSVELSQGNGRNLGPILSAAIRDAEQGKSVMILASCGYMLRPVIAAFKREGVLFHNPFRPTHGGWNPLRGGVGRLLDYLRPDPETWPDDYRIWTWKEAQSWVEFVRSQGSLSRGGKGMIRLLAKDRQKSGEQISTEDGTACFGEAWEELRDVFAAGTPLDWLADRLLASRQATMSYPLAIARKHGRQALKDQPRIILGTIHSVKGGEADSVYLLPDLSPSGMREWKTPGDGRDGIIRAFYVGMTRAKEKLVLGGRWSAASVDWRTVV
jgi:DNA helicase II / ATP-dependent DNA helicase PcrA